MQTLSKTLKSIKETPQDSYEMIDIIPVVDKNWFKHISPGKKSIWFDDIWSLLIINLNLQLLYNKLEVEFRKKFF